MKIQSKLNRCILCLNKPADSWEHIIPECIGGRLQAQILCNDCNNQILGSKLISMVPKDPNIQLAIFNLKKEIPNIFNKIDKHLTYVAPDKIGLIRLKRKGDSFKVVSYKNEKGTFVMDMSNALTHFPRRMRKNGLTGNKIDKKMREFEEAKDAVIIELSNKLKAEKSFGGPVQIKFEGSKLDDRIPTLFAYEFLSLHIRTLIYNEQFNFIRDYIKLGKISERIIVDHMRSDLEEYKPYHIIYPELLENEIAIIIKLFWYLVYKVHFKGLKLISSDPVYVEDLVNKRPIFAHTVEESRQNKYYLFQSKNK